MYQYPFLANLVWIWPFTLLDIILKGYALWRSGKNNQPYWFVILLLVNSLGVLPLIYLIFIDKKPLLKTLKFE